MAAAWHLLRRLGLNSGASPPIQDLKEQLLKKQCDLQLKIKGPTLKSLNSEGPQQAFPETQTNVGTRLDHTQP